MARVFDHVYIVATIVFTVFSQLVMRWQVVEAGAVPDSLLGKIQFILTLLMNPWVITGVVSTFLAGVSWMMAMTRFEIGYAYPWDSLNFLLVFAGGILFFHEVPSVSRLFGTALIIVGIIVVARG
jgi:multidrug transporter EmrE-like cation transporter